METTNKEKLTIKLNKKLNEINELLSDKENYETINQFKMLFTICETLYNILVKSCEVKNDEKPKGMGLNLKKLKRALRLNNYEIDNNLVEFIFSSTKEIRKTRNYLTHEINKKYIEKIIKNKDEYFNAMTNFIKIITAKL